jgi:hypothetical protein
VIGRRTLAALAAVALVAALALTPATSGAQTPTSTHYTGPLPDGGSWIADVPSPWNGTLLLYSHGYGSTAPADSPDPGSQQDLLDQGYALAGSSYDPTGSLWQLGSAVRDQFETLADVESTVLPHQPRDVIAVGTSMGGLISSLESEQSYGRLDGSLTTCGIVAGGLQLGNYQLDGEYAFDHLLAGDSIQIANFGPNGAGDSYAAAAEMGQIAQEAQGSAAGVARLALALSLMNTTTWAVQPGATPPEPNDYAAQELGQYNTDFGGAPPGFPPLTVMEFVQTGRQQIEVAAGGNPNWTVGVNFQRLVDESPYKPEIEALYHAAHLNLNADLRSLTRDANIRASDRAVAWMVRTSDNTGRLQVPELDMHTIADQLVPVQQENYYRNTVALAGRSRLLRQAYVDAQGHCNFTPSEIVAGVHAIQHRIDTGRWDNVFTPAALNASAAQSGLGAGAFIPYEPAPLSGLNGPFNPFRQGIW